MFGFPDDFELNVSESLAYRLLGNSVAIPVIAAVSKLALLHCFRSATKLEKGGKKLRTDKNRNNLPGSSPSCHTSILRPMRLPEGRNVEGAAS